MAYLDFGPTIPVRNIDQPIDEADFRQFEADFRPFVEARESIYRAIPGGATWPSFEPEREKILEYYLTLKAVSIRSATVYLDGASCLSLFPQFVAERHGARVIRQDLLYPAGAQTVDFPRVTGSGWRQFLRRQTIRMTCIGCDACEAPLADESVDLITLHCSFEHFEGDGDGRFAREAMRLLRPNGKLLIIPFYCGDTYTEVVHASFAPGCRFHRYYDPPTFVQRVLSTLDAPFELEMRYYPNSRQLDSRFYCDYSVALLKKGTRTR